jgi:flagellar hook-basal body complex protein FliE
MQAERLTMNINSVGSVNAQMPSLQPTAKKPDNFAALMQHYVEQTNQDSKAAGKAGVELAMGESKNVSEAMLAMQKAKLSFQLMVGVRNKLVDAYREVMRMQV